MDDKDIITLINDGQTHCFEQLVDRYEAKLFRLILGLVGSPEEAQDLTQDVFVKIFQKLSTFQFQSTLGYWFSRIAVNHCRNHLRRKRLIRFFSLDVFREESGADMVDDSSWNQFEYDVEKKDQLKKVMKALDQLSYRHRELVILKDIQELDYKEISSVLSLPVGTVKSGLSRARDQLKKVLLHEEGYL